ncbi:hypothetical protein [Celeribacter persicus]|uniref:Uncharacterized protein n=1 Tax=Celeribacter persicus TaxID=1651082 RepID=A0A2T5HP60_9RHOB|nr:hypothetical protein [Celeribacter persicus]PTQ73349.1 hypothetical protein C8N42_10549 [Celeribacter persicus]
MTVTHTPHDTDTNALLDAAQNWTPPEAPLDMPQQVLERDHVRAEWPRLVRLILPGKTV